MLKGATGYILKCLDGSLSVTFNMSRFGPLHSGAARTIVPVEPEIIMEVPAHVAHKIPNPNKGVL
jgi:mannose-6-phosphate isomerase-like protein (cupin superfamily)